MKRYTYKFTWKDREGKLNVKYLESRSQVEAEEDFEKTFAKSIEGDHVTVRRLR